MKRKNLEKAIVLGLMLGCVYSTAWAAGAGPSAEEKDGNVTLGEIGNPSTATVKNDTNNWQIYQKSIGSADIENLNNVTIVAKGTFSGAFGLSRFSVTGMDISTDNTASDPDGKLNINNNLYIDLTGNKTDDCSSRLGFNLNGIYVTGSTVNANGNVFIRAIGDQGGGDGTINSNAIQVNGVTFGGEEVEIYDNIGTFYVNPDNKSENLVNVIGGIKTEDNGKTIINMANSSSYWYGVVNAGSDDVEISLSNGAKWVPVDYNSSRSETSTQTESIGTLNLNEGGIVDISKYNMDDAPEEAIVEGVAMGADRTAATNHEVSVTNLNGNNGIFRMDLQYISNNVDDYVNDIYDIIYDTQNTVSDYLAIENGGAGTQYIDFNAKDANIDKMNVGDKIYFANVASGDTQFDSTQHVYSSAANINNYEYGVESEAGSGTDWYVTLNNKTPDGNGNFEAAKGAMYAGYALGTELDRLNKRMGEARYLEDEKGVWVRYRHAKTGWDDTFETSSDMFQLGYDKEVQEDDGKHYRGIALDYTDADTTLDNVSGDGEHERYAVSLYDTWLGEKGHYRDLVIRGGRINSDYDLHGMFNDGMYDIGGDYHQWFGSISAEWGRKNDMNDGWYFEPQTQLQLARVGGASYVSDSGIAVDQDGATSLIGRVGFRLGREYAKADGTKHDNYYIKADLLHEFMGDKGIALTGADGRYEHEYDGQETWFDVGLGADISIDKDTYFWVDVEKTLGSDFDNTWQVNGGFRWEF